jgi:polyisoprenoid-binding protein YceI
MSPRLIGAVAALSAAIAFGTPALAAAPLHADSAHSIAHFTVKHFVFSSVQGTMNIVSVDMALVPNSVVPASVEAVIDVNTVNTAETDRDNDLRSKDWFDVATFPTMRFESTHFVPEKAPNTFRAVGTLSLHGVSKPVTLDVTYGGDVQDERGVHHYRYAAQTTLDRRDFGIDAYKSAPLLVGTKVAVSITLEMLADG